MEIDLINEDANDIPLPKVETTFFDKFFLVLIMLLSGGVIWVTMQYSKDMICTSLALLIVAYVGGLALFNCLCFKFKYEIYLAKDILNWKDDMKAQLLYTIMSAGIICGLFWVSWTFMDSWNVMDSWSCMDSWNCTDSWKFMDSWNVMDSGMFCGFLQVYGLL